MKNQELYNKTVSILVKAYQDETLQHSNACGCAVGNMIAANCGIEIVKSADGIYWKGEQSWWIWAVDFGEFDRAYATKTILKQFKATGYTPDQIAKIECAFEYPIFNGQRDDDGFKGLMSVIDALDIIHENTDKPITETTKQLFVKA